jgi:hypothetical protein
MRRAITFLVLLVGPALAPRHGEGLLSVRPVWAQQVVDRIVARVEDDIITLSEVRELGRYQELVQGNPVSDDQLLAQLIEQWIVNREATAARFSRPSEAEVDRELERLEKQFASPEAYRDRLQQLGLSAAAVRRLVERQLYLSRYLDYKFRPAAQVDSGAVEKYYREQLVPAVVARGLVAPALESVEDQIRELLTQREISERASRWLEETKSQLKIELETQDHAS